MADLDSRGCEANGVVQPQAASVLEVEIAPLPTGPVRGRLRRRLA